ncbi:MAG: hypothetical protein M3Q56_03255 [Bacteroidota bacterium]|nr:hypothetical protein [Bacteroidota bacterium]
MEIWETEFEWLRIRHFIKDRFNRSELPDMNAVLFLIGLQELGILKTEKFTKEEKQDIMHIASCRLLSIDEYYEFVGLDSDGWPHYEMVKPFTIKGVKEQELYLQQKMITYFRSEFPEFFK